MKEEREAMIHLITEAQTAGARQSKACEILGISAKTLQRWPQTDNHHDSRLNALHTPTNKLTDLERQCIINVCNEREC